MGVAHEPVVLLVDDDDDLREELAAALARHGYAVVSASNGRQALEALRHPRTPPSLIILDLSMPIMDGVAFLQYQAIDPSLGSVPVVVLTAKDDVANELAGAVIAVLPKPVPLARLLEIVHLVCEQPQEIAARTRASPESDRRAPHRTGDGVERRQTRGSRHPT